MLWLSEDQNGGTTNHNCQSCKDLLVQQITITVTDLVNAFRQKFMAIGRNLWQGNPGLEPSISSFEKSSGYNLKKNHKKRKTLSCIRQLEPNINQVNVVFLPLLVHSL